jgi:hypothetical protein
MTTTNIEWTDRVWSKFLANIEIGAPTDCWLWRAGRFSNGYGQFRVGARKVRAHRAYYERVVGPVPDGLILRHSCDNPLCCNPEHLDPGTHAENAQDREMRGRGVHITPSPQPGAGNPAAKLTASDVLRIRTMVARGDRQSAVAAQLGISQSQVGNIARGACWKEGPWPQTA